MIDYVLLSPAPAPPAYILDPSLFTFTNYPTIVSDCETYSLIDTDGFAVSSKANIILSPLTIPIAYPLQIDIGPSLNPGDIGTDPDRLIKI